MRTRPQVHEGRGLLAGYLHVRGVRVHGEDVRGGRQLRHFRRRWLRQNDRLFRKLFGIDGLLPGKVLHPSHGMPRHLLLGNGPERLRWQHRLLRQL